MTPRSARIERASTPTAGVGIGPVSNTSMPTEVKPATKRGFDHVAGEAGILADQDAMAVFAILEHQPGGLADAQRQFGGNDLVGPTADAVGAEIATNHEIRPLAPSFCGFKSRLPGFFGGPSSLPMACYNRAKAANLPQKL